MTCLNSTFCSAVRCGALQYVHYTSLAQTFGAFWRYACVSYCFHERSDITAFPRCWAANVTLGLQDIEVQVIHITRRSLTCTNTSNTREGIQMMGSLSNSTNIFVSGRKKHFTNYKMNVGETFCQATSFAATSL